MPATELVSIKIDRARDHVERILQRVGANNREATIVADVLLSADLRSQHSHGILRLPTIVGRVKANLIRPNPATVVEQLAPAVSVIDARWGFGHVTAIEAIELAQEIAARTGISLVGIRNNNHIGMLGYYAELAARSGFVTVISTTTEAMVHPYGGSERMLGTNPIAIGIPSEPEPFVLDFSTSTTAIGKIIDSAQRGIPIPADWALDEAGNVTTDATSALAGAINPFGGAKGYGLGVAVALLAGIMIDTARNPDVVGTLDVVHPVNKGDLVIAIDPRVMPNGSSFVARSTEFLDAIRDSKPEAGAEKVLIPGDRGRTRREEATNDGIVLPIAVWQSIEELLRDLDSPIRPESSNTPAEIADRDGTSRGVRPS